MNKKALEKASKIATLSPREIAKIRTDLSRAVSRIQPDVEAVLNGDKKWSQVQLGLYRLLLHKIVPDISATYVDSPNGSSQRISGLSRDELEMMVAERRGDNSVNTITTPQKSSTFDQVIINDDKK